MIALHELLHADADGATVVCRDGAQALTLAGFRARVATLADALVAGERDARDGNGAWRVAICSDDPYDFACALFAVMAAGGEAVIPASAAPAYLVELAPAYDLLLDAGRLAALEAGAAAVSAPVPAASRAIAADAPITLYTSGSSGAAKPVRKTLAQFDAEVRTLQGEWGARIGTAVTLSSVPHHHIYGLLFRLFWPLAAGRAFDRALSSEPQHWRARMAACGAAIVVSTPSQLARWPQLPGFVAPSAAPVLFFSSGGALPAEAAVAYSAGFGAAPFEIFGSTETGGIAWRRQDLDASWQPFAAIAVRRDEDGALRLRSAHLGHDGWHRTDDSVCFDAHGRFALTGRLDRVVKLDGKRVSLPELEARIIEHRFVAQAAATVVDGASRERVGVVAVLSEAGREALLAQGRLALAASLRHDLSTYFDAAALPRHWRFRLAMPFDARGKLPAAAVSGALAPTPEGYELLAEWRDARGWHAELRVPPSLVHFVGHFPGCPILPGVVQVDWAVRLAGGEIGAPHAVRSIDHLKFKAPVLPGAVLVLSLAHDAERRRVRFAFRRGERDCTSGTIVYAEAA
ncbi:AMP-binding protein [Burkholderia plantarii]|uniref:AMP-dependent synthase and ligase n=1 Tax=Burkholderia plantarii TaxID=41899 RepID=A0A0B6S0R4_BURPL|nr:AMP-binding protein [Burkholderia plantarii]AJK45811.1 AMP-dependent synthase and ligase [Burkholderia plantarii]